MPNLLNPHTGQLQYVPDEDLPNLSPGWREETAQEMFDRHLEANREAEYAGGWNALEAGIEGVLSGASLGLWDTFDSGWGARMRAEYNQGWRAVGELAGGLAPAVLTGGGSEAVEGARGAGALTRLLTSSPAGMVGKYGSALSEVLGDTRAARVLTAAAEGSVFGVAGAYSHAQLSDDPLTMEAIFHGAGIGALTGGGISIGFQGLGTIGRGLVKLRGGAEDALSAESPGLSNFSNTWEEMRDYHAGPDPGAPRPPEPAGVVTPERAGGPIKEISQGPLQGPTATEPPRWPGGSGPESTGVPEPVEGDVRQMSGLVPSTGVPAGEIQDYARTPVEQPYRKPFSLAESPYAPVDRDMARADTMYPGPSRGGDTRILPPEMLPGFKPPEEVAQEAAAGATRKLAPSELPASPDRGPAPAQGTVGAIADIWGGEPGVPGGPRGVTERAARAATAERGAASWESRLDREAVPEPVHEDTGYVGAQDQAAKAQSDPAGSREPLPDHPEVDSTVPKAPPQESPHELWTALHGIHGKGDLPDLPTTLDELAGMKAPKAVKLGMTLNALGEHSADLEARVQTLLKDLEGELGVKTVPTETPAQRWMALRKAAREAAGGARGETMAAGGPRVRDIPEGEPPQPSRQRRGFFARWRRRALGNLGESVGRTAAGGRKGGIIAKLAGAGTREGGYVVASLLGGPKGLGLALGGRYLLKSRLGELLTRVGESTPAQVAPLGRTSVWLKDRKTAAREILQLHQAAGQAGNLVYDTVERGHPGSFISGPLAQRVAQVAQFLSSIAPRPGPGLDQANWEPGLSALLPVVQAAEAVANPTRAMARVMAGQSSQEAVQALWVAYPENMAQAGLSLGQVPDKDIAKLSGVKRQALSLLFKVPAGAISPYSDSAAPFRARVFGTGSNAVAQVQAHARAQTQTNPTGRPPETTKLDRLMSGGRA